MTHGARSLAADALDALLDELDELEPDDDELGADMERRKITTKKPTPAKNTNQQQPPKQTTNGSRESRMW